MTAASCAVDDRVAVGLEPICAVVARVIDTLVLATVATNPGQAACLALLAVELRHGGTS